MKKTVLLLLIISAFSSCLRPTNDDWEEKQYKPVLLQRSVFEKSIVLENPQPILKSGKIYIKGDLMFINDINKGFHVYDYSDPKNPILLQFIKAPGATDLAIIDDIIYINQAVDLVTITYNSATKKMDITNRNKNVFPQKRSPNGFYGNPKENEIIIDWKENK
ncbi:hypothetical protein [Flavobacterium limi]|uniref:LVIVD repeat-containing protein n=1 Tax=Flavobacterium limi TaxID=2045105 RepID=A0ABQ1U8J6_9FLAO|nr:hypothetical protein [Flavobacterium limi]GGF12746.1 hypothetical protein GCM10011518_22510 [Flavobacterium limi]